MGIFGTPRVQNSVSANVEANAETEFDFGERKELKGPLPIVDSIVDMVQWLESARIKVAEGGGDCCIAVCAPNPIDGAALEFAVGEIANRFSLSLRSYDKIFRHGREKLLLGLPHVKPKEASAVMQRMHDIVERVPFKMPGGGMELAVKVSLGAALMDGCPVQELINRADKAMEAGRISGNWTGIWSADMA